MNQFWRLLGGIFFTFALAWIGLIAVPVSQLGRLQPFVDEETGDTYPLPRVGLEREGRRIYTANGCIYCHSQQVRSAANSADIARGWGERQTVARDYIEDERVMLGTMRTGPDLSNIGKRQPSAAWHHLHLYNPRGVTPKSIMPPFRFLYETKKTGSVRAADALDLRGSDAPPEGCEVVPTDDARALVAYLLSLNRGHSLPEAKVSAPAK